MFVTGKQAVFDFAFQVGANVFAQTFHGSVGNAQEFSQIGVHFGQLRGFDFVDGNHEVGGFARHVFTVVISGESQGESFAFALFHANCGIFKFAQHLTIAYDELEVFSFATSKRFAVDFAFKINRYAVTGYHDFFRSALGKCAALFTQNIDGFVDRFFSHFGLQFFHFSGSQITDNHFGEHFKNGIKAHGIRRRCRAGSDVGLTSNAQLGFAHGGIECFTDFVVHHFHLHGITVALGHHIHGHFTGTETVHLDRACQLAQACIDFRLNSAQWQRQGNFAFQFFQRFNSNRHDKTPKFSLCLSPSHRPTSNERGEMGRKPVNVWDSRERASFPIRSPFVSG